MAMLLRNKLCFILIFYISGCNSDRNENRRENQFASPEVIVDFVNLRIGENEYLNIWNNANDSIENWNINKLRSWAIDTSTVEFQLDSIICINNLENKVVMAHLGRQLTPIGKLDGISYLYGIKIKDLWYFFSGPTIYVPRNEESINSPTNFTKLHEIAMDTIFKGYLKKNKKGEWEINDDFFGDFTSGAYGGNGPKTQAQWDSVYLQVVKNNWKSRDTTKYGSVQ